MTANLKRIVLLVILGLVPIAISAYPGGVFGQEEEVYKIKPGDTLWDLSSKFLKDPYLWPKLWERNPYITNPHWIYPGRPIRLSPDGVKPPPRPVEEAAQGPAVKEPQAKTVEPTRAAAADVDQRVEPAAEVRLIPMKPLEEGRPATAETRSAGFVNSFDYKGIGVILENKSGKLLLSESDIVYLAFRRREVVSVGDKYTIFRPSEDVFNPVTGQRVGRRYNITGNLQVIDLYQGFYTAKIIEAFEEIRNGDMIQAFSTERMEGQRGR